MVNLTLIHGIYIFGVLSILLTMIMRKDILIPCILFLFLIGFLVSGSLINGTQILFNSIVFSGKSFMDIIVTISVVSALSRLLADLESDYIMMKPAEKLMKNRSSAFWILGLTMLLVSLFLWPSPSVALMGAIMLPLALKAGLKPIEAAIAINIFGHGMALSHDFVIQGASSVTASTTEITSTNILEDGNILFITMSVVTGLIAFFLARKNFDTDKVSIISDTKEHKLTFVSKLIAIITPTIFLIDIIVMQIFSIRGGDATSLIVGSALFILVLGSFLEYKEAAFEKVTDYIKDGFLFGIKIFAPVIIIGAYFFLGGSDVTTMIGKNSFTSSGFMTDFATWLADIAPLEKGSSSLVVMTVGGLTGLDGSGFSGLPLVGSIAHTFGTGLNISVPILASLGQITAIWVGGGTLIPWSVVAVAAVCGVEPIELAKRNLVPVFCGFLATFIMALLIL